MACGTGAREQELQRAILTTLHKIGYLIIEIKNMSTFQCLSVTAICKSNGTQVEFR